MCSNNFNSSVEIRDNTIFTFKTGRWKENSYIVFNSSSRKTILIDPGGEHERIIDHLESLDTTPTFICITHAHHDHVGALKEICEKYKTKFYLHKSDFKLLRRAPLFAMSLESRKLDVPKNEHIFFEENLTSKHVTLTHAPGHTAGGVVIQIDSFAFTGDTLLNKMIGRTDLPGSCPEQLHSSIENFLLPLDDNTILFPGHGVPWTAKEAKEWWAENQDNILEYRVEDNESTI